MTTLFSGQEDLNLIWTALKGNFNLSIKDLIGILKNVRCENIKKEVVELLKQEIQTIKSDIIESIKDQDACTQKLFNFYKNTMTLFVKNVGFNDELTEFIWSFLDPFSATKFFSFSYLKDLYYKEDLSYKVRLSVLSKIFELNVYFQNEISFLKNIRL